MGDMQTGTRSEGRRHQEFAWIMHPDTNLSRNLQWQHNTLEIQSFPAIPHHAHSFKAGGGGGGSGFLFGFVCLFVCFSFFMGGAVAWLRTIRAFED